MQKINKERETVVVCIDTPLSHGHKCPICSDILICEEDCEIDNDYLTEDGIAMGGYETCQSCIKRLEKQKDSIPAFFPSGLILRIYQRS